MRNLHVFCLSIITLSSCSSGASSNPGNLASNSANYEANVMTVEQQEQADPARFLNATGTYHPNFWGNKTVIEGVVENKATVANYKDAVVDVVFYSQTESEIGRERYVIYDYFPAHSSKNFKLKIKAPKATATCGWDVVTATPN